MIHTLAAYLHDLDPVAIPIHGTIAIRWYGLSYLAGFAIAWLILHLLAKRRLILLTTEQVADALVAIVIGTVAGGRIGYALFYRPDLLIDFSPNFPFWGLLNFTEGGMASHGGMIGLTIAAFWIARQSKSSTLHVLDCIALVAPFGIFLGRIANFINAELLGHIVAPPGQPAPAWSVRYPTELKERFSEIQPLWNDEQYAAWHTLLDRFSLPTDPADSWAPVERAISALHRADPEARALFEILLTARHPTQLYQAAAEGILIGVIVWWMARTPRKPGIITGVFLITYALGRIATEFVRLPDAHLQTARILFLSRGQWLSVAMLIIGAALLWWVRTRSTGAPTLGWRTAKTNTAHASSKDTGRS